MTRKLSKSAARKELWRRGDLKFLLHETQLKMLTTLTANKKKISTVLASRRLGKTWLLLVMACELCVSKKNSIVKYICPKQKQGQSNITENMHFILEDCPAELKPEWKEQKKQYEFPNGSVIQVAGTDNGNHENLRGGRADMCIVDEAGFCDHLGYVVRSVLRPTITTTGGKIFLISTPSKLSSHPFIQEFVNPAKAKGDLIKFVIDDNPLIPQEEKDHLHDEYPLGKEDPEYLREYYCEVVQDGDTVVIPEFTEEVEEAIVQDYEVPPFRDYYVSGDIGFKDLTVFLFAYYDFFAAELVIMDELVFRGANEVRTDKMAAAIKTKELELFTNDDGQYQQPLMRVMDNDLKLINDFAHLHQLYFTATQKDNKEAQVNEVRMRVGRKAIRISPKCKTLRYHLKNATWNNNRKSFERMPDSPDKTLKGGHADCVDALVYLVRNVLYSKNPYPADFNELKGPNVFSRHKSKHIDPDLVGMIKSMLNIKK